MFAGDTFFSFYSSIFNIPLHTSDVPHKQCRLSMASFLIYCVLWVDNLPLKPLHYFVECTSPFPLFFPLQMNCRLYALFHLTLSALFCCIASFRRWWKNKKKHYISYVFLTLPLVLQTALSNAPPPGRSFG